MAEVNNLGDGLWVWFRPISTPPTSCCRSRRPAGTWRAGRALQSGGGADDRPPPAVVLPLAGAGATGWGNCRRATCACLPKRRDQPLPCDAASPNSSGSATCRPTRLCCPPTSAGGTLTLRANCLAGTSTPRSNELDCFDADVSTTLDGALQNRGQRIFERLGEPEFACKQGPRRRAHAQPGQPEGGALCSFNLVEKPRRQPRAGADRHQRPGPRHQTKAASSGSSAPPRAAGAHHLPEIVAELHENTPARTPPSCARQARLRDRLSLWAVGIPRRRQGPQPGDAAGGLERRYSASPGEALHRRRRQQPSTTSAKGRRPCSPPCARPLQGSDNLPFVRIMRRRASHHLPGPRQPFQAPRGTRTDPRRQDTSQGRPGGQVSAASGTSIRGQEDRRGSKRPARRPAPGVDRLSAGVPLPVAEGHAPEPGRSSQRAPRRQGVLRAEHRQALRPQRPEAYDLADRGYVWRASTVCSCGSPPTCRQKPDANLGRRGEG